MPRLHRLRRLVTDDATYLWTVRHRHSRTGPCAEVLSLYAEGSKVPLRLVFRAGEGRYVADGLWHAGCVTTGDGRLLNLRKPGAVRQLADAARAGGWLPGVGERDGWVLFDTVFRSAG
ncbi:hypothetical protein [Streptomyces luteolus]|uniref:Uncharacterized protein n=1 Tax=Streptomyces luteolus TaxID=3043615 RepID=A0ABT6SZM0_9ACTN|nr:hypothetical protein [Streptomyces sp. B-S-A12]MDI3421056.1 hypothetical protein [Streptomyces sp. B-S-A12]